ncbi:MAG: quinone-binding protein [Marmoricola sp.]|nr:quinone-binding protein [Marmoricola sp.]
MKLAVFGATGGTGAQVLEQALAEGHSVVAVARRPEAITTTHPALTVVRGDVLDRASISAAIAGADAVVSAFGPASNKEPGTLMSEGIANIVAACGETGVPKLVFESGLITTDGVGLSLFARTAVGVFRALNRKLYDDKVLAEATIRASALAWVIVRPPNLAHGPARSGYRTGVAISINPAKAVRHADVAAFLIACAGDAGLDRTTQVIGY